MSMQIPGGPGAINGGAPGAGGAPAPVVPQPGADTPPRSAGDGVPSPAPAGAGGAGAPAGGAPGGDHEELRLTSAQLAERLERGRRKMLKDVFGVEDEGEARKKLERLQALEADDAKRTREGLTEVEKWKLDAETYKRKAEEIEAKYNDQKMRRAYERQNTVIQGIAAKHIAPDYVGDVSFLFARALKGMDPKQAARIDAPAVEKWFKKYAAAKPAFAIGTAAPPPPQVRQPASNGAPPANRPGGAPSGGGGGAGPSGGGKDIRPGKANSMSPAEWNAEKKRRGLSF